MRLNLVIAFFALFSGIPVFAQSGTSTLSGVSPSTSGSSIAPSATFSSSSVVSLPIPTLHSLSSSSTGSLPTGILPSGSSSSLPASSTSSLGSITITSGSASNIGTSSSGSAPGVSIPISGILPSTVPTTTPTASTTGSGSSNSANSRHSCMVPGWRTILLGVLVLVLG
ncbi:uncharacterized protein PHACADRAFT_260929 [Phanerochaete carnosa HHB-10118-sp]|uniref:REJ domain-containing protein n=1 Tax=Phanerochaete carnosa (strain HHB-10118-sp) TaxID=650164 RepID=K5W0T3_PHACS|nr:uncharacterized protein PHACADRAFT_260929 [Phanerochaete carnosa HHB-10118-sp]EKM52484.1 hypothetical protein PHACADRAFT_260929 [Phanerochaete carnosa HHB-10118-sp]